jgi:hypothetical protein
MNFKISPTIDEMLLSLWFPAVALDTNPGASSIILIPQSLRLKYLQDVNVGYGGCSPYRDALSPNRCESNLVKKEFIFSREL